MWRRNQAARLTECPLDGNDYKGFDGPAAAFASAYRVKWHVVSVDTHRTEGDHLQRQIQFSSRAEENWGIRTVRIAHALSDETRVSRPSETISASELACIFASGGRDLPPRLIWRVLRFVSSRNASFTLFQCRQQTCEASVAQLFMRALAAEVPTT